MIMTITYLWLEVKLPCKLLLWKTIEYSKNVCGRMVPLQISLNQHLNMCSSFLNPEAKVYLILWFDGTSLGSLKTLAGRYRIIYYPGIVKDNMLLRF